MRLIFLYGLPATGKLTIAQELSLLTGYRLFHNHLAVDLLLSVFDFGTAPFVRLREDIWLSVFAEAASSDLPGLIFTFAPEDTVTPDFISNAIQTVTDHDGEILFVELTCPIPELRERLNQPSRHGFAKLTSVELFDQLHASGSFHALSLPEPVLTIDTSSTTAHDAAREIARALSLPQAPDPSAPGE